MLVLMALFLALDQDLFLTYTNLNNVFRGLTVDLLLAVGSTFLITTGMLDLSIGSLLALSTMVLAGLLYLGVPSPLAAVLTVLFAAAVGGLGLGSLIAKARLSFLVVGLGGLSLFRSAAQLPTSGRSIPLSSTPGFGFIEWIGDGEIGPVSVPVVLSILCLFSSWFVLKRTNFGRAVFAVGGNEQAARLAGIPVDRVRMAVFAINGLFVGLAAIVFAGRIQAASPTIGVGIELQVIAAVLLGGSAFAGGAGTVVGSFIGVMFIAILQNGLNLVRVDVFWQGVVTGLVLVAAVWIDRLRTRKR
jgi:ribose/xylose/arabinose/galactoside ABC-type transport system permease subunit